MRDLFTAAGSMTLTAGLHLPHAGRSFGLVGLNKLLLGFAMLKVSPNPSWLAQWLAATAALKQEWTAPATAKVISGMSAAAGEGRMRGCSCACPCTQALWALASLGIKAPCSWLQHVERVTGGDPGSLSGMQVQLLLCCTAPQPLADPGPVGAHAGGHAAVVLGPSGLQAIHCIP